MSSYVSIWEPNRQTQAKVAQLCEPETRLVPDWERNPSTVDPPPSRTNPSHPGNLNGFVQGGGTRKTHVHILMLSRDIPSIFP